LVGRYGYSDKTSKQQNNTNEIEKNEFRKVNLMRSHVYPHDVLGLLSPFDDHFSVLKLILRFHISITKIGNNVN
jgi:hypothetical protein